MLETKLLPRSSAMYRAVALEEAQSDQECVEETNESETSSLKLAKYPEAVRAKAGAVVSGGAGVSRGGTQ
ncbi:hypothetical protein NDU88_004788 [Pleurodeles waltl]|uniref:Uncharacterized protein n=1 Tax=Pleurodeles waltl TaxID=8319 RepID=A0AAV7VLA9_PLEWA|nr:hypothetical protein NDU88_004788 [Pleurodeles waltl]